MKQACRMRLAYRKREKAGLLARAADRTLQLRLPALACLALGLADDEGTAADVLRGIEFIVCHDEVLV